VGPATQADRRFAELTFDDFRRMARDEALSTHEKVGFPDAYREGREAAILADVCAKLPALDVRGAVVVDVGAGCGGLATLLREHCRAHAHALTFVDSAEMLAHHPDGDDLTKIPGRFPHDCAELLAERRGEVDALIAYSVLQYAFADASPFAFLDAALELLAPGGRLLFGDLPNASMRKRFLASDAGAAHHRAYSGRDEDPQVAFNTSDPGQLDDGALVGLLLRARAAGFHAWLVPQPAELPMGNRREDLLIARP
jgi:2-polyprenyl-3-methyl-5-hydroxy-6-metoxy-1,4-benzoquinol methylase